MRRPSLLAILAVSLCAGSPALPADKPAGTKPNLAARSAALAAMCSREVTGSRVRRREGDCAETAYAFRTYSEQQLAIKRLTAAQQPANTPF